MSQKLGLVLASPVYCLRSCLLLELPPLELDLELLLPDLEPDLEDLEPDLEELLLDLLLDLVLYLPDSKSINSEKNTGSNCFLTSLDCTAFMKLAGCLYSKSFLTHLLPLMTTNSYFPYL